MPKRGTDPETIDQALTRLESSLVDRCSATEEKPAQVVKTTRVQPDSPLQPVAIPAWPEWTMAGMRPRLGDEG